MVAAVAVFGAVACTQELDNNVPEANGETVVFTAYADGADETKTVLNTTGEKPVSEWDGDDAITIYNGEKGFTFTTTDKGAKAVFSYTGEGFGGEKFIAVYPAREYNADVEAKTVEAYIPTYQEAVENTYNETAALAIAYSENTSLKFKNATALLKFSVNGTNVKALEFFGKNGEALTGNMLVSLNEDGTIMSVEGQDTVFEEGKDEEWTGKGTWVKIYGREADNWCFKNGATYYVAIAPNNFTKGVTAKLIFDAGDGAENAVEVKTTDNPVDLKPNTILDLGALGGLEYTAPATVETVYLKPNADWAQADAWFAAHFFNPVGGIVDVKMTDENEDGIYEKPFQRVLIRSSSVV